MELIKSASLIVAIFVVGASTTKCGIQEFLLDNGHHYVDLFYNSSNWRGIEFEDLYLTRLTFEDIEKAHNNSFGIFMFDATKDDLKSFLSAITHRRIKMSLLIISEPWEGKDMNEIKQKLLELKVTAFFYIATPTSNSTCLTWHQIISLNTGSVLNHLEFATNTSKIIEKFDMQGLEIRSSSLSWAPYLTIENCSANGLDCENNHGYLIDLMDKLAVKFNFTYVSEKNMNNSWFHVGPHGISGGVWGDFESKQYDMSLSLWYWLLSRDRIFDFAPLLMKRHVLAYTPQHSNIVDCTHFTRAFVWKSWTVIMCILGAIIFVILITNTSQINDNKYSVRIVILMSWLFFTLINSYYCGVLTMFFATTNDVRFETISDVMKAYPDWKLRFNVGYRGLIHDMAKRGDPDYALLWQRYQENSTESTFDSIQDGLELMESGQNVLLMEQNMLLGHLKSHSTKQEIKVIERENLGFGCILFSKNTPLLPMFNQGVRHFRESGLEGQLFFKWFGKLNKQSGSNTSGGQALTLSEMVTAFIMMLVVFIVAFFVLCGELTLKQFFNKQSYNGQRRDIKYVYSYYAHVPNTNI